MEVLVLVDEYVIIINGRLLRKRKLLHLERARNSWYDEGNDLIGYEPAHSQIVMEHRTRRFPTYLVVAHYHLVPNLFEMNLFVVGGGGGGGGGGGSGALAVGAERRSCRTRRSSSAARDSSGCSSLARSRMAEEPIPFA